MKQHLYSKAALPWSWNLDDHMMAVTSERGLSFYKCIYTSKENKRGENELELLTRDAESDSELKKCCRPAQPAAEGRKAALGT